MWTSRHRALRAALVVAALGLVALNVAFAWWGHARFLPAQNTRRAVAQGNGCVLIIGDSRMVAGIDVAAMQESLRGRGMDVCVANAAVGGLPPQGFPIVLRHMLEQTQPRLVLLGLSGHELAETGPVTRAQLAGNGAAMLWWGQWGDSAFLFPGWPLKHLDDGLVFHLSRVSPLGALASALWKRAQQLQTALTTPNEARVDRNTFGQKADMEALAQAWVHAPPSAPTSARAAPPAWWSAFEAQLAERKLPLAVVRIPMPAAYRAGHPAAVEQLNHLVAGHPGWRFGDLGVLPDGTEEDFPDGLHLGQHGASLFSQAIGQFVADGL